jgi:hypothetical protein
MAMANGAESIGLEAPSWMTRAQAGGRTRFDWAMIALCGWFLGGLYLDGWAHNHLDTLDSFFTPWHGAFYSGFGAVASLTVGALLRNHARGDPWRRALPPGYELSLVGALIFAVSGVGDMIWHLTFGIEVRMEALLSPTHLGLTMGVALLVSGPFRAAWRRANDAWLPTWTSQGPMVVSLALLLSVFTFWTMFTHPLSRPWAAVGNRPTAPIFPLVAPNPDLVTHDGGIFSIDIGQSLGIDDILLQTALLMALVLLLVRRWGWRVPHGSFTLVFTLNACLMGFMRDQQILIPAAIIAGIGADGLLHQLKPSAARPVAVRLFACGVPVIFYSMYFLTLKLVEGIWWSVHLWAGAIILAGIVGWLVSYLIMAPQVPQEGISLTP